MIWLLIYLIMAAITFFISAWLTGWRSLRIPLIFALASPIIWGALIFGSIGILLVELADTIGGE